MILGFTGTRRGLSPTQFHALSLVIQQYGEFTELHHGCCIGADEQAHRELSPFVSGDIVGWPCTLTNQVSDWCLDHCTKLMSTKPPLVRNQQIVQHCDILVAAPLTSEEQLRSGTWHTIRYARRRGMKPIILHRGT